MITSYSKSNCVILTFAVCLLLSSCCTSESSKVPSGYPFGDWQELNFSIINPCITHNKWGYVDYMHSENLISIMDRSACDKMMKQIDTTCNICKEIDFNKNCIIYLHGRFNNNSNNEFYPRVIINHKIKNCIIELRGYNKVCQENNNNIPSFLLKDMFSEVLLIPKPPDDYIINTRTFNPVHASDR